MGTHLKADKDYIMGRKKFNIPKEYIDLLGKVRDSEISRLSGISYQNIRNRRIALGIPKSSNAKKISHTKRQVILKKGEEVNLEALDKKYPGIVNKLGTQTDSSIAKQYNISRERVRQFRAMLFLCKVERNPIENLSTVDRRYLDDNLGLMTDKSLAEQLGLKPAVVSQYRKNKNVNSLGANRRKLVLTQKHRLGKDSDSVIARHLNVYTNLVRDVRIELGIQPNPKNNPRWGSVKAIRETRNKRISEMYYAGCSDQEIAEELCLGVTYIGVLRRRLGLFHRNCRGAYKKRASNE
tara:strand:+ start:243 stop:1127 length:885 start_codon:yes stop_codon:yes gene_type:complete